MVTKDAVSPGVNFQVLSAYDHGTTTTTNLLTTKVTGDNLTLTYNPAKSGVADVTVRATDANTDESLGDDTFTVTYKPNLIVTATGESLQPFFGPGDTAQGQVAVANDGAAVLSGLYNVKYYLSDVPASDSTQGTQHGITLEDSDRLIGTFAHQIDLASGKSAVLTDTITIPSDLASDATNYKIIASVTPADGSTGNELYTNDQTFVGSSTHEISNTFGSLVSGNSLVRSHSSITYLDAAGQTVVATLTGPGLGMVTPLYDSGHNLVGTDLDFFNTTAATVITVKSVTPVNSTSGVAHTDIGTVRVNVDGANDPLAIGTLNLGLGRSHE